MQLQQGRGQLSRERRKSSFRQAGRDQVPNKGICSKWGYTLHSQEAWAGCVKSRAFSSWQLLTELCFAFLTNGPDTAHALHSSRKISCKCTRKEKSSRKSEASSDLVIYHQSDCCLAGSGWLGAWTSWKGAGREVEAAFFLFKAASPERSVCRLCWSWCWKKGLADFVLELMLKGRKTLQLASWC